MSHILFGGKIIESVAEGSSLDELRIWVSNLQYEHKTFEKGSTPGGAEGGEVYSFEMTEGEYPGFSYIIS